MGIIIDTQQEQQCIWVEAGVLNFKLCDRNFHCEHCPLDAALRDHDAYCMQEHPELTYRKVDLQLPDDVPDSLQPLLAPLRSISLCENMQYSARHIWARVMLNGMVACGLDAFGAALLPDDLQIVIVANHTTLQEGDTFGWVYGGSHTVPLSAPVSGTVVCRNTFLRTTPDVVRSAPYEKGALVTISPSVASLAHAQLSTPRNHDRRIRKRARTLSDRITRMLASPMVGPCLNDGGAPVSSLEQMLGEERYWKLLSNFIGGE
ncbi:hypothetical protein KQI65_04590 [bacterium]|nr:hypothetical protein [bacterium]